MDSRNDLAGSGIDPELDVLMKQQTQNEVMTHESDNYEYLRQLTDITQRVPEEVSGVFWVIHNKVAQLTNLKENEIRGYDRWIETRVLEAEMMVAWWEYDLSLHLNLKQAEALFKLAIRRSRDAGFERRMQVSKINVGQYEYQSKDQTPRGGLMGGINRMMGKR